MVVWRNLWVKIGTVLELIIDVPYPGVVANNDAGLARENRKIVGLASVVTRVADVCLHEQVVPEVLRQAVVIGGVSCNVLQLDAEGARLVR